MSNDCTYRADDYNREPPIDCSIVSRCFRLPASATVTIMVEDINDHAPRFTHKLYRASMSENLGVGASIISVSATDADVGQYAKLTYSLKEQDRQFFSIFSVEATNTGVLKVFRVRAAACPEFHTLYMFCI